VNEIPPKVVPTSHRNPKDPKNGDVFWKLHGTWLSQLGKTNWEKWSRQCAKKAGDKN